MHNQLLLIGSTGLIGSACKKLLLELNSFKLLTPSKKELNLLCKESTVSYFKKHLPSYVILAAGLSAGISYNQTYSFDMIHTNLTMQLNAFHAANEIKVERMIFFGSSCMYPKFCKQPMQEKDLFSGVLEPTSLSYSIAKLSGLQLAKSANTQHKNDRFLTVIPNTVYGPNDHFDEEKGHVIPSLIQRFYEAKKKNISEVILWGDGSPKREFIHSSDVARATVFLLTKKGIPHPINIGTQKEVSIYDLAENLKKILGFHGPIYWDKTKPNGSPRKLLDSSQLQSLGWSPKTSLNQGLQETCKWYIAQRKSHEKDPLFL